MKLFGLPALSAATLLAAVGAAPVHASYVCTGLAGPADTSTPYFNGDLTDAQCDITEVEAALGGGITIDESLIVGSKSNADDEGPITLWTQDEFGLGTLTPTAGATDQEGSWSLTGGGITPLFWVEKYDRGYDIYTYMGPGTEPFSDSWDGLANRGNIGEPCDGGGGVNCNAATSHISVYGVVPIPAAVWLFGSGLLGLVSIARRRRS